MIYDRAMGDGRMGGDREGGDREGMGAGSAGMTRSDDPVSFELFKNALFAIADEMAVTICRTTYSGVLRDNMDFSTSIADGDGCLVAQGLTLPMHLGSVQTALRVVLERYRDSMSPGDVFILNDPFDGGMHLPDIFMFKPVYLDGRRVAFACTTPIMPTSAAECPAPTSPTRPRSTRRGCASRRCA